MENIISVKDSSRRFEPHQKRGKKMENKKVWCFNCYGVWINRMCVSEIEEWNNTHRLASDKITSWKEQPKGYSITKRKAEKNVSKFLQKYT